MNANEIVIGRKYVHMDVPPGKKYKEPVFVTARGIDEDSDVVTLTDDKGREFLLHVSELEPLPYTTVGELIEKLKTFDPNMGVELKIAWHHGHNFCIASKDRFDEKLKFGTGVCAYEWCDVIVIENAHSDDYDMDED